MARTSTAPATGTDAPVNGPANGQSKSGKAGTKPTVKLDVKPKADATV